jgi:hypothetical protein
MRASACHTLQHVKESYCMLGAASQAFQKRLTSAYVFRANQPGNARIKICRAAYDAVSILKNVSIIRPLNCKYKKCKYNPPIKLRYIYTTYPRYPRDYSADYTTSIRTSDYSITHLSKSADYTIMRIIPWFGGLPTNGPRIIPLLIRRLYHYADYTMVRLINHRHSAYYTTFSDVFFRRKKGC